MLLAYNSIGIYILTISLTFLADSSQSMSCQFSKTNVLFNSFVVEYWTSMQEAQYENCSEVVSESKISVKNKIRNQIPEVFVFRKIDGIIVLIVLVPLFLFIWFYRKYELYKTKEKYASLIKDSKTGLKESEYSIQNKTVTKIIKDTNCLTGRSNERDCFFLADGEIQDGYRIEAVKSFLPKINGSIFCEHACGDGNFSESQNCHRTPMIKFIKHQRELVSIWDPFLDTSSNENELKNENRIAENMIYWRNLRSDSGSFKAIDLHKDEKFLRQVFGLIQDNHTDYSYTTECLCKELHLSVSQINRRLNLLTGYPAGRLIRLFRLRSAAKLLLQNEGSITDICFNSGFNELGYFSRAFKKQFGCSPSIYKKLMTKKSEYMRI